jgi:hypothetical protein
MVVMVSFFAAAMTIVTGVVTFPASSPADDANYSAAALGTVHVTTYRTKRRGGRIFPYVGVAGQSPVVVVIVVGCGGVAGTPKADGGHRRPGGGGGRDKKREGKEEEVDDIDAYVVRPDVSTPTPTPTSLLLHPARSCVLLSTIFFHVLVSLQTQTDY